MHDLMVGRLQDGVDAKVHRVLVDRLWPRGISKAAAPWDSWLKEVAPSHDLRKWYGHDPDRHHEFRKRYWQELTDNPRVAELLSLWRIQGVMLLTASKNLELSQVPILRDFLIQLSSKP